jgi:hypothetical protein
MNYAMKIDSEQQRQQARGDKSPFQTDPSQSSIGPAFRANQVSPSRVNTFQRAVYVNVAGDNEIPFAGSLIFLFCVSVFRVYENTDDWLECFDPKNRRCYYYSAQLKQSTWHKPSRFVPLRNRNGSARSVSPSVMSTLAQSARSTSNSRSRVGETSTDRSLMRANMGNTPSIGDDGSESGVSSNNGSIRLVSTTPTKARSPESFAYGSTYYPDAISVRSSSASSAGNRQSSPFVNSASNAASRQNPIPLSQPRQLTRQGSNPRNGANMSSNSSLSSTINTATRSNSNISMSGNNSVSSISSAAGARSNSAGRGGKVWASAVDPVSQRIYWYNR